VAKKQTKRHARRREIPAEGDGQRGIEPAWSGGENKNNENGLIFSDDSRSSR
jgi:hypothetical protein